MVDKDLKKLFDFLFIMIKYDVVVLNKTLRFDELYFLLFLFALIFME